MRLVLGSMTQVEKSNLLTASVSYGNDFFEIESICLTDRAWRLMGYMDKGQNRAINAFLDTFTYLQVIVDDFILPIPKSVFNHFKYEKGFDYGYLAGPADLYSKETMRMIQKKVKLVFIFIDILRVSLECEKVAFSKVFDKLDKHINLPNVDDIENSVRDSLKPIQNFFRKVDSAYDYKKFIMDRNKYVDGLLEDLTLVYGVDKELIQVK